MACLLDPVSVQPVTRPCASSVMLIATVHSSQVRPFLWVCTSYQEASAFGFPILGVWTKPSANFIAIEPWYGFSDPDVFLGDIRRKPGMFEVSPGATKTMAMSITLESSFSV